MIDTEKQTLSLCIELMKECLQDAPVDFLGTGSNSKASSQEELEWRDKWQGSYISAKDILKK